MTNYEVIKSTFRKPESIERFTEVLGSSRNANAYISSAIIAVANNQALQECEPLSVLTSAMRAASLRLSCDPATGQAWLVPFKGKATLVVGYKGLKDLALRTNKYRYLNVATIYDGQTVEEDQLRGIHKLIGFKSGPKARPIGYLLYMEFMSGYQKSFYMTVEEIHEHARKYSKSYGNETSPWKTATQQMEIKTVFRLGMSRYGYFDPNDAAALSEIEDDEEVTSEAEEIAEAVEYDELEPRTIEQNINELFPQ